MLTHSIENSVLSMLENISGTREVRENLDIALFDEHIIDSFDLMCVIIEVSEKFQIDISPAQVERVAWSTPRKIIEYVENRLSK